MIAAAVLVSLWAQAEPAPPEPAPLSPPAPAPLSPPALPPVGPRALAPPPPSGPPALANAFALWGRFAYRLGEEGDSLGPAAGFAIGGSFEHRYFRREGEVGVDLGVGVDFSFARFATSVMRTPLPPTTEQPFDDTRALTQTGFALMQTATLVLPSVRLFAAGGAGATISYFSTPELDLTPGSMSAVQPIARASVGVEIPLSKVMAVTVGADYTHAFTRPTYTTTGGQTYSFLGDLVAAGAGVKLRF